MEPNAEQKKNARKIYSVLLKRDPEPRCALVHQDPFQLLVATILSAQCTDERVNMVTPDLFRKYPTPRAMSRAGLPDIERLIRSTGFYRNKAKSISGASRVLVESFGGEVPDTMDELLTLPGVARKTANVILGTAFEKNVGVVVDTHIARLSRRMAFTVQKDPVKIEQDLMLLFPKRNWTTLGHLLIWHGRRTCNARSPKCEDCAVLKWCPRIDIG